MSSDIQPPTAGRRRPPRLTRCARAVLGALEGKERPTAALELLDQLRARGERTGLTTIYRCLHSLAAGGAVHEFSLDGQVRYLACGPSPHDHLICAVCGRVEPRPLLDREELTWTARAAEFTLVDQSITVVGRCSRCLPPPT